MTINNKVFGHPDLGRSVIACLDTWGFLSKNTMDLNKHGEFGAPRNDGMSTADA
jgi:hypothetical protein